MSGNSLVAGPVDLTTPFSGTFMLESGEALCAAISNGDWVAGGLAAFSLAMDGISMALDPIGSLIAMGLGWLMDHIEPLKSWLNDLTGDAGEVAGFASTWQNIAAHLQQAGESLEASLRGLASMQGQTADAFRAFHADAAKHLAASGEWAAAIGTGMTIASTIVKMVHDMTRDAISTVVGTAVSATITTVATLGFGAPVAVAQVTSKVASLVGKLTKFITNMVRSVTQLIKLADELVDVFRRLMTTMAGAIRNIPTRTPDAPAVRPPGGGAPPRPAARPASTYSRPSGYRSGVRKETWESNADADGVVLDPLTGQRIDPSSGWHMGHRPGYEFWKLQRWGEQNQVTRQEFLDAFNNPDHFRPELPSSNVSHLGEDRSDLFLGP